MIGSARALTGRARMKVVRVFADSHGESHFEDLDIALDEVSYGRASQEMPATASVSIRDDDDGSA